MSDLLRIGASAVGAYRSALSVIGENVANAETKGYVRRDIALQEMGTASSGPLFRAGIGGGGVATAGITRAWDDFKAADARNASGEAAAAETQARWLGAIEGAVPDGDAGVATKLTQFFTAGNRLSADPGSTVTRGAMLSALGEAVGAINAAGAGLVRVRDGIATEAGATVSAANTNLSALAAVNQAILRAPAGSNGKAALADERDRLVDDLAATIAIDARVAADGTVAVSLVGSPDAVLVSGAAAKGLAVTTGADGRIGFTLGGATIMPTGGRLAGLATAAGLVADNRQALDGIAADLTGQVNSWQAQGRTAAKAAGPALLSGSTAATLALTGAVAADIAAASADGTANGNLARLADLRGSDGVEARLSDLVIANARSLSTAQAQATATGTRRDAALAARSDLSGVDLDREAAELIRFQQAYDGSARIIQVARETLQSILQLF